MNLFSLNAQHHDPKDGNHEIVTYDAEINTNEGSEFLDDAIRMVEQPLTINNENEDTGHEE